jgi:hypothetical protein
MNDVTVQQPLRPDVEARIRTKVEHWIPDEAARREVLGLLAYAIEMADDERRDAWYLRELPHGLALMPGRLVAIRIARGKLYVSAIGPVAEDLLTALGATADEGDTFKSIPGSLFLAIPIQGMPQGLDRLKEPLSRFIDEATVRVRRAVTLEAHVPEAVAYVSSVVGRDLPQPTPRPDEPDDDADGDAEATAASREPMARGRAPIFENGQRAVATLVEEIDREAVALPDMQRTFVWEDTKVRDLLDSLFLGFPVGTLVLWHTSDEREARGVGTESRALRATTLVIDGQQRLTSLFAVMRGKDITDKDGTRRRITIAFRPRDGRFEVADAAIRQDPEFLPNVTELWSNTRTNAEIRRDIIKALKAKGREVDDAYGDAVDQNLERAKGISDYRFPTVEIRKTALAKEVTDEDVADIFVRINNQGTRLQQADFVLTLLSVFHGDLRDRIEGRAREMSEGAVVPVDAQQVLRVACAVAFSRARMSAIYKFLRGIDPTTSDPSPQDRKKRLDTLDLAANQCLESTPWRDYMLRVKHAGFVSQGLVASSSAIINAYAFYVIGQRLAVPKHRLDEAISRWLFGTLLTRRYSSSSETVFEEDLGRMRSVQEGDADGFVKTLDDALSEKITGDYWTHTLVAALETQRGRAPAALAFRAAQVVLGARALFSDQLLQNLLDPPGKGGRSASEMHHLFPKAWLQEHGVRDRRRINQVANMADVGWYENSIIAAHSPAKYVPRLRERLSMTDERWGSACAEHALPMGWDTMDYDTFLRQRQPRMADVIRVAYRKLGGEPGALPITPPWFVPGAEVVWQRIAETERALRVVVREVYAAQYRDGAAQRIEEALGERERETLTRALRARPAGADALSVVDYLYIGQLPQLLFAGSVWQEARHRFGDASDAKAKLQAAVSQIIPVRNEIAHVREVPQDRLQRASLACGDVLGMLKLGT